MKTADIVRAILYPLTEFSVVVPLVVFWLLISITSLAGGLGLLLIFLLIVPAVFRFQMIVLEARARDVTPVTPGLEFFNWFGNAWTLFPFVLVVLPGWLTLSVVREFGVAWATLPVILTSIFLPAAIAVLAITHSPLQSLNLLALGRLWKRCGGMFWVATLFMLFASWLAAVSEQLPSVWANFAQLFLSFSFFSLVGSLIQPYGLIYDIEIPEAAERDSEELAGDLEKNRTDVLNHAYGFISRDNREGGFNHLFEWIREDPDPVSAWAFFFARMLLWEDQAPALFFAQHYLHDQLQYGEHLPAVKLVMRCRLIDARFKPFPEDIEAAIAACHKCDNHELAAILGQN